MPHLVRCFCPAFCKPCPPSLSKSRMKRWHQNPGVREPKKHQGHWNPFYRQLVVSLSCSSSCIFLPIYTTAIATAILSAIFIDCIAFNASCLGCFKCKGNEGISRQLLLCNGLTLWWNHFSIPLVSHVPMGSRWPSAGPHGRQGDCPWTGLLPAGKPSNDGTVQAFSVEPNLVTVFLTLWLSFLREGHSQGSGVLSFQLCANRKPWSLNSIVDSF